MVDFVNTARAKDEKVQESTLKGELAQFVLALREDDGSSLLENVTDFSNARRELSAVAVRTPFFAYFLTHANAKHLTATAINWEPPRACALDFSEQSANGTPRSLRACFAVVPDDALGRYIYFSLKYPTPEIVRHRSGLPVGNSSSVVLQLRGETTTSLRLMFEQPRLVQSRYPSQLRRFAGLHEVTAYPSDHSGAPLRAVQAQAFEKRVETTDGSDANYVTILGRIDAAFIFPSQKAVDGWSTGGFRALRADIEVYDVPSSGGAAQRNLAAPFGSKGTALQSLEQAYFTFIQSRANLEVFDVPVAPRRGRLLWSSNSISGADKVPPGAIQKLSDWWATRMVKLFDYKRQEAHVDQAIRGQAQYRATLTAEPILLPDLATRAFLGLSTALVAVFSLGLFWMWAVWQLRKIARLALNVTQFSSTIDMEQYRQRRDEIGLIGRTFSVLIRRFRTRNASVFRKIRMLEMQRRARALLVDEQIKARQDVLSAIGHEIKSPLQSLLNRTDENSELRPDLEKMRRAIDALYLSASVEGGLRDRVIVVRQGDIAAFMETLTRNLIEQGRPVEYQGAASGVLALYDPIALEGVLDNVLDNAYRHMRTGTQVNVMLSETEAAVQLTVSNTGALIPETDLDAIFGYGFSTRTSADNIGLGLFSARIYILGMRGTIKASNSDDGVFFTLTLPKNLPDL